MRASCLCGKGQIGIFGKPLLHVLCHCEKCRIVSGVVTAAIQFDKNDLEITGDFIEYTYSTPNDDQATMSTCRHCGVTMFRTVDTHPGIVSIMLGCLDNSETLVPDVQIWTSQKLPWLIDDGSIPSAEGDAAVGKRLEMALDNMMGEEDIGY